MGAFDEFKHHGDLRVFDFRILAAATVLSSTVAISKF
jgi:hypothetical protein